MSISQTFVFKRVHQQSFSCSEKNLNEHECWYNQSTNMYFWSSTLCSYDAITHKLKTQLNAHLMQLANKGEFPIFEDSVNNLDDLDKTLVVSIDIEPIRCRALHVRRMMATQEFQN